MPIYWKRAIRVNLVAFNFEREVCKMEKNYYFIQALITGAGAWFSARLGILFPLLVVLVICMVIDYLTGYAASACEAIENPNDPQVGWNSKKGTLGIMKKFGYMFVIAVCIILDYIIKVAGTKLGFAMPVMAMFGMIAAVWYILNELLSIVENAGRMGAPVPAWLQKYISVLKGKIDSKMDEEETEEEA